MLYEFLVANRERILELTRKKTARISEDKPTTLQSERGLPEFYDHLAAELEREAKSQPKRVQRKHGPGSTARHGKEMSRLGYTVSQVVDGYAVISEAITEVAKAAKAPIKPKEFGALNLALDLAISEAVEGFGKRMGESVCNERMGALAHELRNALTAAIIAHSMVRKGVVGTGGSTNALLERNLSRMRDIIDRSFSEVRMKHEKSADLRPMRVLDIVEEVEATSGARERGREIELDVDPHLRIVGDHHYLISALSNLVQNAVKYSKEGGTIWVRGRESGARVLLEVEDRCGGLPKGKAEELFQPFVQKSSDRSGLGLGLTIARRAAALNGGTLEVRDLPGEGCVFTISLPKADRPRAAARTRHAGRQAARANAAAHVSA
ncbi:MAG TPA: HAMP domain-containing sensor histidine kinase [Elusimicrobiota bacterium]|nr:HAMP domain-containing sensor histidine kinase [Elusimicrobiota bacterium]